MLAGVGVGTNVFSISGDPVGCDLALCRFKVQLAADYQRMEPVLQTIFDMCVPNRPIGFRPEILDRIGTDDRKRNEIIDLLFFGLMLSDSVLGVHLAF